MYNADGVSTHLYVVGDFCKFVKSDRGSIF